MNKDIFEFLNAYNEEEQIDRLLVSAFIDKHKITKVKNKFIQSMIINEKDKDFVFFQEFINLIKKYYKEFCFESLMELFEYVIPGNDKLINGAVYTPKNIREYITKEAFNDTKIKDYNTILVSDIACGVGGFLLEAIDELKAKTNNSFKYIYTNNIFGIDIQEYSINRAKILLSLYAIFNNEDEEFFDFNLYVGNSLTFDWNRSNIKFKHAGGFDIILGNPPYVCSRNMDKETKDLMQNWSVCKSGHPDLYIPFFQIGYELLKKNGVLGFITVSTFIKSLNGRAVRNFFSEKSILLKIIDFEDEQIFEDKTTYTCICFLEKKYSKNIHYTIEKSKKLTSKIPFYNKVSYDHLDNTKGWHLKNTEIIRRIESTGTPLGEIYNTKSGIATLRNSIFIFKHVSEDKKYFYLENGKKIEKDICKRIVNSNYLANKEDINNLVENLIFPYTYIDDKPILIEENEFEKNYPHAHDYLLSHIDSLNQRDKGKGKYFWYEYGRNQSMEVTNYKLLFPQLANEGFNCLISDDTDLYFNNGMAALSNNKEELEILSKIFRSSLFWFYVKSTSKYYSSNYYSLGRNYIKNFGIYDFSDKEKEYLLSLTEKKEIDIFLESLYNIHI
ncbi:type II DNA methyltransferase [Malaciobacter mytili LMG 24559]|uniref:HsdM family class I SAM-dependent methyltransferase n=1 Tax=Malaciobacter mytili TaxID=603050 RepID=UPI000E10DE02|nr:N-6 DNA methylase [Malaciobacter mytili]AXH15174.1 type II DNA methyltransferase [Malaciobacter mytili LMG 24559]